MAAGGRHERGQTAEFILVTSAWQRKQRPLRKTNVHLRRIYIIVQSNATFIE